MLASAHDPLGCEATEGANGRSRGAREDARLPLRLRQSASVIHARGPRIPIGLGFILQARGCAAFGDLRGQLINELVSLLRASAAAQRRASAERDGRIAREEGGQHRADDLGALLQEAARRAVVLHAPRRRLKQIALEAGIPPCLRRLLRHEVLIHPIANPAGDIIDATADGLHTARFGKGEVRVSRHRL